ncbi:hypothetical protein D3C78_1089600 [compost metagenome]
MISANYLRDPSDERWKNTREFDDYKAFMAKYNAGGDMTDSLNVLGYTSAQTLEYVLRKAGDNLTRENIMKVAANMSFTLPMLYPGIDVKTSADDFHPIERMQLLRFAGTRYEPLGPVMGR